MAHATRPCFALRGLAGRRNGFGGQSRRLEPGFARRRRRPDRPSAAGSQPRSRTRCGSSNAPILGRSWRMAQTSSRTDQPRASRPARDRRRASCPPRHSRWPRERGHADRFDPGLAPGRPHHARPRRHHRYRSANLHGRAGRLGASATALPDDSCRRARHAAGCAGTGPSDGPSAPEIHVSAADVSESDGRLDDAATVGARCSRSLASTTC